MLETSEQMILRAAIGWLELGLPKEALAELAPLASPAGHHPDVLELRWQIFAQLKDWNEALAVSSELIAVAPQLASTWLHHAYALRRARAGGLQEAFEALAAAATRFRDEPTIYYNLACYVCQMQRPASETMAWLEKALQIGEPKSLFEMALADPDLDPVRELIRTRQAGG